MLMFTHWSGILSHWQAFCVYVAFIPLMEVVIAKWLRLSFWHCQRCRKCSLLQVVGRSLVETGGFPFQERFLRLGNQLCYKPEQKSKMQKFLRKRKLFHPHLLTEGAARAFEICSCHHTKRCQRLVGRQLGIRRMGSHLFCLVSDVILTLLK